MSATIAAERKGVAIEPDGKAASRIIKLLEGISRRHHRRTVFVDWINCCEASLRMLPHHAVSLSNTGQMAEDPEDVAELFRRLLAQYDSAEIKLMAHALGELVKSAEQGYQDIPGEVYMAWEIGNTAAGQYFTPWPICEMMVRMMVESGPEIYSRVDEAAERIGELGILKMGELMLEDRDYAYERYVRTRFVALAPYLEPIKAHDPACGSGRTLLAAASIMPQWAVRYGVVQFYGQDIDHTCCQMARINMRLYGLNGTGLCTTTGEVERIHMGSKLQAVAATKEHIPEAPVVQVVQKVERPVQLSFF